MSDFENETARKIKEQLRNEELNGDKEEKTEERPIENSEEDIYAIDKSQYELEPFESVSEELEKKQQDEVVENKEESNEGVITDVNKEVNKGKIFSNIFSTTKPKTEHFKRKEKARPLSLIVGILSLIVCLGIVSVSVWAIIKIAPPVGGVISGLAGIFFTETVLAFSLGFGWLFGGVIIFLVVAFVVMVMSVFVVLSFVTIGIPIVAFSTFRQPKQVFAYNKDASGNMIFSYILGALISFFGFAIYMDGSFSPFVYISTLVVGIVFLVVAVLLTIDIIQCKKYFRNYDNETEKQEIIQEAEDIETAKKEKKKRRKALGKLFSMLSKK